MKKKCIIISIDELPILVCDVKELEPLAFVTKQRECAQNLSYFKALQKTKERDLKEKIAALENEIKLLKGEE